MPPIKRLSTSTAGNICCKSNIGLDEIIINVINVSTIQGESGEAAERGFPGLPGPKGELGERGIRGEKGEKGDMGLPGIFHSFSSPPCNRRRRPSSDYRPKLFDGHPVGSTPPGMADLAWNRRVQLDGRPVNPAPI
jgi:hypothetical protein